MFEDPGPLDDPEELEEPELLGLLVFEEVPPFTGSFPAITPVVPFSALTSVPSVFTTISLALAFTFETLPAPSIVAFASAFTVFTFASFATSICVLAASSLITTSFISDFPLSSTFAFSATISMA